MDSSPTLLLAFSLGALLGAATVTLLRRHHHHAHDHHQPPPPPRPAANANAAANASDASSDSDDDDDDDDTAGSAEAYKMVLVVNDSLKMGMGKIAAQCCHACLGAWRRGGEDAKRAWSRQGQAKVCLRAPETEDLLRLEAEARRLGLPCYLVADAGRTQIAAGSLTVLGVGPAPVSKIDKVTGALKLL